jgi:hypothetical protein
MRVLYLATFLPPLTSAYMKFASDPHDILRRSKWAGQSSYLNMTTWAEPNCQGIANPFIAATNQVPVDLMPSQVKSYSLNRTLGGVEQLDFSVDDRPPALPSVATTTTSATVGPPGGAGHVGPTTWVTDVYALATSADCALDYAQSEMSIHNIAVPSCHGKRDLVQEQGKRNLKPGRCVTWIWTADDAAKDGGPGNCHTLPGDLVADCWNIWVHG